MVFAEVLEHLHTSPRHVLDFLRTIVAPGGVLILQTPNAVAFHKRLYMLCGRNPFELFREDLCRPGHYREYTLAELGSYARKSGFELVSGKYQSYFDYRYRGHGPGRRANPHRGSSILANTFYRYCPAQLKPGLMLVLRRPRVDPPGRHVRGSGSGAAGEASLAAEVSATSA